MSTHRDSNNFQGTSIIADSPISSPVPLGISLFDPTETEVFYDNLSSPLSTLVHEHRSPTLIIEMDLILVFSARASESSTPKYADVAAILLCPQ